MKIRRGFKSRRGLFSGVVMLLAAAAVISFGSAAAATTKAGPIGLKGTIGFMFPDAGQPTVQALLRAAYPEAAKRNVKLQLDDPGTSITAQAAVINTWITEKIGAIETVADIPQTFNKLAGQAKLAGIPWVTYAASLSNESAEVSFKHYFGGKLLGEAAGKWITANAAALGGKAQVALITYSSAAFGQERAAGIKAGLNGTAPGKFTIVGAQDALDAPTGDQIVATILQAHPGLNMVLCISDTPCEGAYQALLHAGHPKNDPKLFVGGMDGTPAVFSLIKARTFYRASAALDIGALGRAVVDVPANIIDHKPARSAILTPVLLSDASPTAELDRFAAYYGK